MLGGKRPAVIANAPAFLEDFPAATSFHPSEETMYTLSLAPTGLVGSLQDRSPLSSRFTNGRAFEAQHPFRPSQPDNEVRRKAIAMAYDIFDVKPPKKIEVGKADQFDIELDFEDVQRIEAYTGEELLDAEIIEEDEEKEDESIGREDMEPL